MPRRPRLPNPWQRKDTGDYYITIRRRQYFLGKATDDISEIHKAAAARLMEAGTETKREQGSLLSLMGRWLQHSENTNERDTFLQRKRFLQSFTDFLKSKGELEIVIADLRPFHVSQWMDSNPQWNVSSRRTAMSVIYSALNWSKKEGYIDNNPLHGRLKRPAIVSRGEEVYLNEENYGLLLSACGTDSHREILTALYRTGCRPSELRTLGLAKDTGFFPEKGCLVVKGKRTRANTTGIRTVLLDPFMIEFCKRLRLKHPDGALFRTRSGSSWSRAGLTQAFQGMRNRAIKAHPEKTEAFKKVIAYGMRHSFATNCLRRGEADTMVSKQLGHEGTAMLHAHYSHVKVEDARSMMSRIPIGEAERLMFGDSGGNQTPVPSILSASPLPNSGPQVS